MTRSSRATSASVRAAGRLVHDEDVAGQRDGLGDFEKLLVAHAEATCGRSWIDWALEFGQEYRGLPLHRGVVEQAQGRLSLAAEEDIGRCGELLHQIQLLVDDRDSGGLCVAGATKSHWLAPDEDRAHRSR